jgi:hypothetical protein
LLGFPQVGLAAYFLEDRQSSRLRAEYSTYTLGTLHMFCTNCPNPCPCKVERQQLLRPRDEYYSAHSEFDLLFHPLIASAPSIQHPGHLRYYANSHRVNAYAQDTRPISFETLCERPPIGADG